MNIIKFIVFIFLLSCASRPVLYPNSTFKEYGKENAEMEIDTCLEEGEKYLQSSKAKQILKGAGKGSIFGAVVGGVTGLITGDVKNAIGRGALVGGAAGATAGAISPDQLKRAYVNQCLADKGYRVIGWD